MDLSSFFTSLGTSCLIFLALALVFAFLSRRPSNTVVYYPARVLREELDSREDDGEGWRSWIGSNPFAWVKEAITAPESRVVAEAGVDAAVYLLYLRTALGVTALSGALLLPILLPLARTDHNIELQLKEAEQANAAAVASTFNALDKLAMGNIQAKSPRLWGFLFGTYWVTFTTFFLLWKAYKHASDLRAAAKSGRSRPEDYAVLVRDIPPVPKGSSSRKEQVDCYFRRLHPDAYYKSMLITDIAEAEKVYAELESNRKKLARAEAILAATKTSTTNDDVARPTHRTGFLGLCGDRVETIEYCQEKITELHSQLENEQKLSIREKQQPAAVVFFTSRHAAVCAGHSLHAQAVDTWTVEEAPEPRQLIWPNLGKTNYERRVRSCVVYGIVFATVVFYMVPITFVSAFTTLENLRKILPFLSVIVDQPVAKTVLEAYLPQLALILFMALLPKFLLFLSRFEGIPTQSHLVRAASGKYFYFVVFNVFLGVTIGGTLFSSLKTVEKNPNQIVPMLGKNLPANASFFLTYVALQFFVGYGMELCRITPLVIYHLKRKYLCKTEEEIKEAWAPGDFGYDKRVPNDMLILTIVLCYSVIAPIIIPFGFLYFGLGWIILRHQAFNVYVPEYESHGRMWPHMQKRILAALIIYQVTMIGYFGVKKFYYSPLLLPLPILSFIFANVCHNRFYLAFMRTPLEVACGIDQVLVGGPNMDAVCTAFVPPCMANEGMSSASEMFEDCRSTVSRTPSV